MVLIPWFEPIITPTRDRNLHRWSQVVFAVVVINSKLQGRFPPAETRKKRLVGTGPTFSLTLSLTLSAVIPCKILTRVCFCHTPIASRVCCNHKKLQSSDGDVAEQSNT